MGWYDWLLFLHVAAALAAVTAVVFMVVLLLSARRTQPAAAAGPLLRLSPIAARLWDIGGAGTLVFGIWLAIYVDGYEVWDGWIIAALVLWVIAAAAGTRVGAGYRRALRAGREGSGEVSTTLGTNAAAAQHAVMTLAIAALLVVMIYKPGA